MSTSSKAATRSTSIKDVAEDVVSISVKDLTTMINNAVKKQFDELKKELYELFASRLDAVESRCKDIESDLNVKTEKLMELESRVDKLDELPKPENVALIPDLEEIKQQARLATVMSNDCEQYSRRSNIRIRGLKTSPDSNVREIVASWINSTLSQGERKFTVTPDDLGNAHPLPSKSKSNSDGQPGNANTHYPTILVRFLNRDLRDKVISACKVLKSTEFSISDDLTSLNVQLINRLKQSDRVDTAWSWQGKIYAKLKNDKIVVPRPFQSIDDLYAR